jgi:pilus assembly protein CpaF
MRARTNTMWDFIYELEDKQGITEVIINSPKKVFVERGGHFIQLNVSLKKEDIIDFAQDVAEMNQRPFDDEHPVLDGVLEDGSRINIINEPFAKGSPAITIRKYLKSIKSFEENEGIFGLDKSWVVFLQALVSSRCNLVVSGGTGVGKTTLLNLLLKEIVPSQRIISVEDTIELSIETPNVVRLECFHHMSTRELVKNALRMRPDRIIVGEVRGAELFDLLQAMNTGHDGSMSSIHSSSSSECLSRIENLFMMAGFDIPVPVVRKQIAYGIDFIIQLGRDREGKRVITDIMEITGMEGANILSHKLAIRDDETLISTGISPKIMDKLHRQGGLPMNFFQKNS